MFKARIKILVRELGPEQFRARVLQEWAPLKDGPLTLSDAEIARVQSHFAPPPYKTDAVDDSRGRAEGEPGFARWLQYNTVAHKVPGYRAAYVSLKSKGRPPGDATAEEMELVADLADKYSFGLVRTTHTQILLLADVEGRDLFALWSALKERGLASANIGTLQDIICCPGFDYCNLANAHSIPIAKAITERFDDLDYLYDLGELKLKMSGCINSCGHHHVGHIGILGVDLKDTKGYQILLGGNDGSLDSQKDSASIGKWIGPALSAEQVVPAFEKLLLTYVDKREADERFLDTVRRIGLKPFAEAVYG
jgi:sulfite reductase (NADPH) hemoprotein beta-component